mmetsp:Transcript_40571/g.46551  ORF Transcript_40571/g.46551 Transcript_40571/m.46551 type:complete len:278 (-) Transcript_40571:190-1023(-)
MVFSSLAPLIPCFASTFSILAGKEKVNLYKVTGILLAFSSSILPLLYNYRRLEDLNYLSGVGLITLFVIFDAIGIVCAESLLHKSSYATLPIVTLAFTLAFLLDIPAFFLREDLATLKERIDNIPTVFSVVIAIVIADTTIHSIMYWSLRHLKISEVSIYDALQPLFLVIFIQIRPSAFETYDISYIFGVMAAILAMFIMDYGLIKEKQSKYIPKAQQTRAQSVISCGESEFGLSSVEELVPVVRFRKDHKSGQIQKVFEMQDDTEQNPYRSCTIKT